MQGEQEIYFVVAKLEVGGARGADDESEVGRDSQASWKEGESTEGIAGVMAGYNG